VSRSFDTNIHEIWTRYVNSLGIIINDAILRNRGLCQIDMIPHQRRNFQLREGIFRDWKLHSPTTHFINPLDRHRLLLTQQYKSTTSLLIFLLIQLIKTHFASHSFHSYDTQMQLFLLTVLSTLIAYVTSSPLVERKFCSTVTAKAACDNSVEQDCSVNSLKVAICITDSIFNSNGTWRIEQCTGNCFINANGVGHCVV